MKYEIVTTADSKKTDFLLFGYRTYAMPNTI